MKKSITYVACILVCGMITNFANAQTQPAQVDPNALHKLTDSKMSQRLAKDWSMRNSSVKNQPVEWYDSNDGFYGTYSSGDKQFMTRYDKQGHYVETLTKRNWDDTVPANLKSSFDKSEYKSQMINSYWEVTDANRKGYYLELTNDQGQIVNLWADDKGNFSTTPRTLNSKN